MCKIVYIIAIFAAVVITSCATDELDSPVAQPVVSDNIYDEFNRWVYYQMNEQYLWREDLPDSLDCNYDLTPKEFFTSLLSEEDRFSYFTTNPNYRNSRAFSYNKLLGFEFQKVCDASGREWLYVLYVYGNNARSQGLKRGDLLKQISYGVYRKAHVVNGEINGLEPDEIKLGFNVGNEKNSVLLDSIYDIEDKTIGYLCYLEYADIEDLILPLTKFATSGIDELILDLRYNPGGYVKTCKFLCNCIIPSAYYESIFQICSYNDRISQKYLHETGNEYSYSYFSGLPQPGEEILGDHAIIPLILDKITIITSSHTASASEATIICLKPYMDVISIGEQTVGKGVGSWLISNPKYKYAIQPITMRYYNSVGETTPDEGLEPDYYISDGYSVNKKDIGDTQETLLNFALSLIVPSLYEQLPTNRESSINIESTLTPIGEPSFVTEFKNKQYNEIN